MELIILSGTGTLALLVSLFTDYVVDETSRSSASGGGVRRDPHAASPATVQRSRADALAYDRAA